MERLLGDYLEIYLKSINMCKVKSEDVQPYMTTLAGPGTPAEPANRAAEDSIIQQALFIVRSRLNITSYNLTNPSATRTFLELELLGEKDEHFCCLFLDSRNRLIKFERVFHGTIDGASVFPRVVVRRALEWNAAGVILAHNHPSGVAEASEADKRITRRLKEALALVDIKVLDSMIVGSEGSFSFAEKGLL